MGSAGYVARRVPQVIFSRTAGVVVAVTGVASTFAGPYIAVINHATFVCRDYHRVVLRSEGPDQHIHVVLHPLCQVAPDGRRYGGNGGVEVEVGVGVLKMAEDAGERAPELASSIGSSFQACHHAGEEAKVTGIVIRVGMQSVLVAAMASAVLALTLRS